MEYRYGAKANALTGITTESTDYTFETDAFGNTTGISAGDFSLVSYTYNENNGKLNTLCYGNGLEIRYVYDALDRISEIQYNIGTDKAFETVYEYTYDSAGNLYSITDKVLDQTTMYCYDNAGKLVQSYVYDNSTMYNLYGVNVMYDGQSRVSMVRTGYDYSVSGSYSNDAIVYSYGYNDATGTLSSMSFSSTGVIGTITPRHDSLGRMTGKGITYNSSTSAEVELFRNNIDITYYEDNGLLSYLVSQYESEVELGNGQTQTTTYNYSYDSNGYITEIRNGSNVIQNKYYYDDLGQLIREDNLAKNATYVYTYDNAGNITSKKTYAFTVGTLGELQRTDTYTYGNASWGDLLTNYNGVDIKYTLETDSDDNIIGNPVEIGGYDLTWQGRELVRFTDNDELDIRFEYNADGIRTLKNVNGTKHKYTLSGSQIITETWGNVTVVYLYDESGAPIGMKYRVSSYAENVFKLYFFEKNLQGDIIAVYNESGAKIGTYTYDAWGNHTATAISTATALERVIVTSYNPFRYRGYYYDTETGFYYLQSRYYNPTWGRFINADSSDYLGANGDLLSYNLFAYCSNNPVMYSDPSGCFMISTAVLIGAIVGAIVLGTVGGVVAHEIAKENGADEEALWGWTALGVLGGAIIGAACGAAIGYGVGYLAGGTYANDLVAKSVTNGVKNFFSQPNKVHKLLTVERHNLLRYTDKAAKKLMKKTLSKGISMSYKTVQSMYLPSIKSQVTYVILENGMIAISDMWIKGGG